jgi:hypothetical protein
MDAQGEFQLRLLLCCVVAAGAIGTHCHHKPSFNECLGFSNDSEAGNFWSDSFQSWSVPTFASSWKFAENCWRLSDSFVVDSIRWIRTETLEAWEWVIFDRSLPFLFGNFLLG